ncbi:MAG: hypothetical protein IJA65_01130 [Acholeplasmatales bacterium]|nr:hypothetical protein [Acholeplasmatales bacterium]
MCKAFDDLNLVVRVILIIFLGWIVCPVYRILKWADSKNIVTLIVGILGIVTGNFFGILWIVDLVTTILGKGISVLAD